MKFLDIVQNIFQNKFERYHEYKIDKRKYFLNKFLELGLPTTKHEEWKYTNLSFINDLSFSFGDENKTLSENQNLSELELSDFLNFNIIHIFNGYFLDSQNGLNGFVEFNKLDDDRVFSGKSFLMNFEQFFDNNNPFGFLNLATFSDARLLKIRNDVALEKPLVLQYNYDFGVPSLSNTLSFIEVGENSKAEIIVLFRSLSSARVLANEFINLHLKRNANVEISFVQFDTENLILLNNFNVVTQSDVNFKCNTFSFETQFVRNNLNLAFEGLNSLGFLNGINIVSGNNFIDNHTVVLHNKPSCTSEEDYRGIISDQARAIFNGKIYVARDAQKTNAYQSNKNILLSNEARVYTRPQLEIYADDVKCTHGATAGFLDQDVLYYITARGIGKDKAKALLLNSFVSRNLERVEQPELRNFLKEMVAKKLNLEDIFFCSSIAELSKV